MRTFAATLTLGALVLTACECGQPSNEEGPTASDTSAAADTSAAPDTPSSLDTSAGVDASADTAPAPPRPLSEACVQLGGTEWLDLSEASGAARLDAAGERMLIVADSGNRGAALVVDAATLGATAATLPMDSGSDDVEGLSRAPGGALVGLTSGGWLRAWQVDGSAAPSLEAGPYAASADTDWVCGVGQGNCKRNYEGLCLHPDPAPGACVGFAASKASGLLVCLRSSEGRYVLDPTTTITIVDDPPDNLELGPLSGCTFEPTAPHRLVVGGNAFTASALWEVQGYDGADPAVVTLPMSGAANQEAVLFLADGVLASFGDLQGIETTSPLVRYQCR